MLDSVNSPVIDLEYEVTITDGYHNLSHHGTKPVYGIQTYAWH